MDYGGQSFCKGHFEQVSLSKGVQIGETLIRIIYLQIIIQMIKEFCKVTGVIEEDTRAKSNASESANRALPCTVTGILHSTTHTQILAHCCTNA